jgi:hypothetical protein
VNQISTPKKRSNVEQAECAAWRIRADANIPEGRRHLHFDRRPGQLASSGTLALEGELGNNLKLMWVGLVFSFAYRDT